MSLGCPKGPFRSSISSGSIALYLNVSLSVVSYFAAIIGIYVAIDAYGILTYDLTKEPLLAALGYLSAAGALVLSLPAVHTDNKLIRWIFAIFSFLFAVAWLYQGFEFNHGHLEPPAPANATAT